MTTPVLETERILLRPLSVADAPVIFKTWTSDPEVARYMNWNRHETVQDTVEWLTLEEENIQKDSNYTWGFVHKGTEVLFGSGGLNFSNEAGLYELGYNICKRDWNQGLTTEAAEAILDFAVSQLDIHTFYARHAKENPASGRVMEKVGFVFQKEGTYSSFDGKRIFLCREYLLNR